MKVLFISSGNNNPKGSIIVQNQAQSLIYEGINIENFIIVGTGILGYVKNVTRLRVLIKKNSYDILHSHYSMSAFVATLALLFNRKIPHIVSLMGSDTKAREPLISIIKYLSKNIWNITIVKSQKMLEDIELSGVEIVPNGVDVDKIIDLENEMSLAEERISFEKTHTILFAADPSREEKNYSLAKQAGRLLNIKISTAYNKNHVGILKEILCSKIILLTSQYEGSPNIIKEAMACNIPIVSTDVGDVSWLFGDKSGHFLTSFESSDVAKKIEYALEFYEKHGRTNGRRRILELGLDSKSIAQNIIVLYYQCLTFNHK